MREESSILYLLADKRFYAPIDSYVPNDAEYRELVEAHLDKTWQITRASVWYNCMPPGAWEMMSAQGWKIHLSSTIVGARICLERALPVLRNLNVPFKFAADQNMLTLLNNKFWSRGAGGKFLTIYPASQDQFKDLCSILAKATEGLEGPYILSDKRYKNSKTVYYRYGGFKPLSKLMPNGTRKLYIVDPEGLWIEDSRQPYYQCPVWLSDPFEIPTPVQSEDVKRDELTLNNGRYTIMESLQFSNAGGIYIALDSFTNREVVIKRPAQMYA